jgi:hypothetical protein
MSEGRNVPPIGTPCNLWGTIVQNAAGSTITPQAVAANGYSQIVDTRNSPFISAFGNVSGATTVNLQYSADGVNFNTAHSLAASGAGDFNIDCLCGAQFVRLQSTNAINAYATVQAKGG